MAQMVIYRECGYLRVMKARIRCSLTDEFGRAMPARVSIEDAHGDYHAPRGALSYGINTPPAWPSDWGVKGRKQYFYAEGKFSLSVPKGKIRITASRGCEYVPFDKVITISRREENIPVVLSRFIDLPAQGWFCGDNHIHLTHPPLDYELRPQDGLFIAAAEGLQIAGCLDQCFRGQDLNNGKCQVHFGVELGHYPVLNLKKRLQKNLTYNLARPAFWFSLPDWVRKNGGTITMGHPFLCNHLFSGLFTSDVSVASMCHYELPLNVALGKVDAFDKENNRCSSLRVWLRIWYGLLNCGFCLPLSTGTDACPSVKTTLPAGVYRLYAQSNSLDYGQWLAAMKNGRSFLTDGPLLFFEAGGFQPGETIRLTGKGKRTLEILCRALSIYPMDSVELVKNGKVIRSWKLNQAKRFQQKCRINIKACCWLALRTYRERTADRPELFAHTSPVYVYCGGRKIVSPRAARFFLEWIEYFRRFRVKKDGLGNNSTVCLWQKAQDKYLGQLPPAVKKIFFRRKKEIANISLTDFQETGPNHIANPGFDAGHYWKVSGGGRIWLDAKSCWIRRGHAAKHTFTMCYQKVKVTSRAYYVLRGEIRKKTGVAAESMAGYVLARIVALDQAGHFLGQAEAKTGGGDWEKCSALLYVEKGIKKLTIACVLEDEGAAGFRNIVLRKCEGPFIELFC